jgi:phage repressor protein C with HTH and peptisase S24 domain
MVPEILPGDILWIVKRDGEGIRDGAIYIWRSRYDGVLVKRARIMPDGSTALQGNRDPEPVGRILPFDDDPPFEVIGRVARVEKPI